MSRGIAPARPSIVSRGSIGGITKESADGPTNICEVCMKTFTSASALRRHNMSKHLQLGVKFACSICGMQYKTKWSLSTHISRYHRPASEKIVRKKSSGVAGGTKAADNSQEGVGAQGGAEFVVVKNE